MCVIHIDVRLRTWEGAPSQHITMDTKHSTTDSRIWIHMKIIHACLLFVTFGTICGFWICFNELQSLRKELNAEIAKRTVVEFTDLTVSNLPTSNESNPFEHQIVLTYEDTKGVNSKNRDLNEKEKLVRVKRRARRKAYYKEEPQDMVWLTSYSRIPVSIFHVYHLEFCQENNLFKKAYNNIMH